MKSHEMDCPVSIPGACGTPQSYQRQKDLGHADEMVGAMAQSIHFSDTAATENGRMSCMYEGG
jgi:hypothetical protein